MLNSGKCKLGDNPMRASEAGQCTRGPMSSRPSWHLKLPGSAGSDHGLFQLNTKGGVELRDLCMLSVQSQSQHHSPASGWHLTSTEVSLNSHCFKALLFLSSHCGSAWATCYPSARCTAVLLVILYEKQGKSSLQQVRDNFHLVCSIHCVTSHMRKDIKLCCTCSRFLSALLWTKDYLTLLTRK